MISRLFSWTIWSILLVAVAVIFVRASLGVPLLIAAACFNIVTYMNRDRHQEQQDTAVVHTVATHAKLIKVIEIVRERVLTCAPHSGQNLQPGGA